MNMNFQQQHRLELERLAPEPNKISHPIAEGDVPRTSWTEYLLWAAILVGAGYLVLNASGIALLIVAGTFAALLAVATAACIKVQNESPW